MKIPRVLIFTITYSGKDYCFWDWFQSTTELTYKNTKHIIIDNTEDGGIYFNELKQRMKEFPDVEVYHTQRGNNSREALSRSQNFARKYAIENNFDYILSIESDIFAPKDTIQKLLVHCKPVVTALYHIGDRSKGVRVPCITLPKWSNELGAWGTRLLAIDEFKEYQSNGLKQVQAGGLGCTLIRKDVFKNFRFWYDPRFQGHSDIYFFNDLFIKGIPVFVDTDITCDHQNVPWSEVKDR